MKLSKAQQNDLECIKYFLFGDLLDIEITDEDIKAFFDFSEKGIKPEIITKGYNALCEGKRWRGIHIHEMWEQGILDGSVPYWVLLGGHEDEEIMPRSVVDFMKKEMFKGKDSDLIEECYQKIIKNKDENINVLQ